MPSDSGDQEQKCSQNRRTVKDAQATGAPPPEQEHLPCPRCDSTNTKFCYYNNYNFSQPRHFCKSCRRYWTHGGTLRDIPVGGGTRKNTKRSRTATSATTTTATSYNNPISATPVFLNPGGGAALQFGDWKGNMGNGCGGDGSFNSLLNTHGPGGFLALGGFGLGLSGGFEEMGFGLGRAFWPFPAMGGDCGSGGPHGGMMNTWEIENGEGGGIVNVGVSPVGAELCSWPELAISSPGNGLK
ncbi:hypothetical protein C1H46_018509 [Malus baccata]|uniref:Dof zinc finger protein n=1 Tax=Malus baccata TaxID=106549 RepID=A0A540MAX4_MALBA|nr:hypothetical protein C1H46_018509 [Malus baccata]